MALNRRFTAWLLVALGAAVLGGGVALIYLPAGIIAWGVALVALGLLTDVDGGEG